MKQLDLFNDCTPLNKESKRDGTVWKLFIDGASRNNPGPAGAGVFLTKNDEEVIKAGFFLGEKTNNQAEYLSLILGVHFALKYIDTQHDALYIFSDSELLVRQLTGMYKVKNEELRFLKELVLTMLSGISYSICHVLRAHNTVADKLANLGVDKKIKLPLEFHTMLRHYGYQI